MGISLTANNSSHCFYMGYGGFFSLRKNIALALDEDFGRNYALLISCNTDSEYEENDAISTKIIRDKQLDRDYRDVLDFLYMPDCEGDVSYKTCRHILDLIKDVDFGKKGSDTVHIRIMIMRNLKHFSLNVIAIVGK